MSPSTNIDGTEITGATIDGQDVQEITVDGDTVFTAIPDSGLLRYEFEDDSDTTTAIDSWESDTVAAYDGTINGATYSTESNVGNRSLSFDGNDDDVAINSDSAFPTDFASDGLTITAQIKFNSLPSGTMAIAEHVGASTGWSFLTNNSGDLELFHRSSDSNVTASISGLTTGSWHFCVGQYDQNNNQYRVRIDNSSNTVNDSTALDNSSVGNKIGIDANNNFARLDAVVSDYRIYNEFLTSSELDDIQ